MNTPNIGVVCPVENLSAADAAAMITKAERLGYASFWIGGGARPVRDGLDAAQPDRTNQGGAECTTVTNNAGANITGMIASCPGCNATLSYDERGHLQQSYSLINGPVGAVLVRDKISPPDERLPANQFQFRALHCDGDVYWQLTGPVLSDEQILQFLDEATLFPFTVLFCIQPPGISGDTHSFQEFVNNLVGIAVGAFDEESFLVWWNERVPLELEIELP